jgi:hypothetical protein
MSKSGKFLLNKTKTRAKEQQPLIHIVFFNIKET